MPEKGERRVNRRPEKGSTKGKGGLNIAWFRDLGDLRSFCDDYYEGLRVSNNKIGVTAVSPLPFNFNPPSPRTKILSTPATVNDARTPRIVHDEQFPVPEQQEKQDLCCCQKPGTKDEFTKAQDGRVARGARAVLLAITAYVPVGFFPFPFVRIHNVVGRVGAVNKASRQTKLVTKANTISALQSVAHKVEVQGSTRLVKGLIGITSGPIVHKCTLYYSGIQRKNDSFVWRTADSPPEADTSVTHCQRAKRVARYTYTDRRGVSVRLPGVVHIDLRSTVDIAHTSSSGTDSGPYESSNGRASVDQLAHAAFIRNARTVARNEANQIPSNHWPAT
ncbi:hypothetical protein WN48_09867 [Eufriesea mexicana]|nr:hypothetical protein WN48_09867 [Eufriesea mexicana]